MRPISRRARFELASELLKLALLGALAAHAHALARLVQQPQRLRALLARRDARKVRGAKMRGAKGRWVTPRA